MGNVSLNTAQRNRYDEFYTQYNDVGDEVDAYVDYDPDVFRGKVVYCNCDDPYESNFFRYFALNFNRLGLKQLITTSYKPSPISNTQLELYGDDKTVPQVEGRPKVTANRFIINEVSGIDGDDQFNLKDVAEKLKANKNNEWLPLENNGDFRSAECIELLKQADVVVTNPPFSLFREYIKQLLEYEKSFLVVANKNALTYKEVFPLIKANKIWAGAQSMSMDMLFDVPKEHADYLVKEKKENSAYKIIDGVVKGRSQAIWLTNLDHGRRHEEMDLMTMSHNLKHSKHKEIRGKTAYDKYDNYDAIEVPFTDAIPSDYKGVMGVPIGFFERYNPEQFEILGSNRGVDQDPNKIYGRGSLLNGEEVYKRIFIRHKQ